MYKPSHKVKLASVLYAQGFTAGQIAFNLGVSESAIRNRLYRMGKRSPGSWETLKSIRKSYRESNRNLSSPYFVGDFDYTGINSTMSLWTDHGDIELRVLRKF